MARSAARRCCLVLMAGLMVHLSCALLVSNRHGTMRRALRPSRQPTHLYSTMKSGTDYSTAASGPQKSPESNFFVAIARDDNATSSSIPAIHGLDRETGPLPRGAYRQLNADVAAPCLLAIGINPPSTAKEGGEVWRVGAMNCQKLIDSGFNTFRVNDMHNNVLRGKNNVGMKRRRRSPASAALEQMQQRTSLTEMRHQAETDFYHALRQTTPPSVLRTCHLMVNLEMPSILSDDSIMSQEERLPVPFGDGWMVRESISDALRRTQGECLDTVVLDYRKNSPYHLDVLNSLFEMKHEGLIQSISTRNFPPSLLRSALASGFGIESNDVLGNLMNTKNIRSDSELGIVCEDAGLSRLISAPLGGGLFTQQYSQFREWERVSASGKTKFRNLLDSCCKMQPEANSLQKWERYRTIMDALDLVALKYQVSVESVALRWRLQSNESDSISVGSQLGMDFVEEQGGQRYDRQRNLRQVFTFSLEEDDMERLCQVAGFASNTSRDSDHEIDFANKALWM